MSEQSEEYEVRYERGSISSSQYHKLLKVLAKSFPVSTFRNRSRLNDYTVKMVEANSLSQLWSLSKSLLFRVEDINANIYRCIKKRLYLPREDDSAVGRHYITEVSRFDVTRMLETSTDVSVYCDIIRSMEATDKYRVECRVVASTEQQTHEVDTTTLHSDLTIVAKVCQMLLMGEMMLVTHDERVSVENYVSLYASHIEARQHPSILTVDDMNNFDMSFVTIRSVPRGKRKILVYHLGKAYTALFENGTATEINKLWEGIAAYRDCILDIVLSKDAHSSETRTHVIDIIVINSSVKQLTNGNIFVVEDNNFLEDMTVARPVVADFYDYCIRLTSNGGVSEDLSSLILVSADGKNRWECKRRKVHVATLISIVCGDDDHYFGSVMMADGQQYHNVILQRDVNEYTIGCSVELLLLENDNLCGSGVATKTLTTKRLTTVSDDALQLSCFRACAMLMKLCGKSRVFTTQRMMKVMLRKYSIDSIEDVSDTTTEVKVIYNRHRSQPVALRIRDKATIQSMELPIVIESANVESFSRFSRSTFVKGLAGFLMGLCLIDSIVDQR